MYPFSVVIICRNEADVIGRTIESLSGLTDDIVVYDTGSTDGTQDQLRRLPVRLLEGPWEGFGRTKSSAIAQARYDWILNLDADEAVSEPLHRSLRAWRPEHDRYIYRVAFHNYFGERHLRFGEWGRDYHIRLFNRRQVHWDEAPVHERLILPQGSQVRTLKGHVIHRTVRDQADFREKMRRYAALGAQKYFQQGRKASWFRRVGGPVVTFLHYYIIKLGFLDGHAGWTCARMTAWYTRQKYRGLKQLQDTGKLID